MIEISCHFCGKSYAAYITLGRGETRHQPAEPDTVEPGEWPAAGMTPTRARLLRRMDRVAHEREVEADGERQLERENERE